MNTREQFGNYLLLKKLTEDPLGETFRAGMLGAKGMERVVLLRIFNGQGVDGGRLWQETRERAAIQQILRSPNIGEGVEMGELQGIPYVAYDYVSGRNMATLLETANRKKNFIPAEHALLIAERVALALAVACENRHAGERILHGFLVPHLVMISNEGETRVLGFEVGPGLRSFASNPVIRQHFGRYLAPETASGQPMDRSDDIWSLGVLLFELLTSKPLPTAEAGGYAAVIDGATLATEGTPIPPDLAQLLKQSLVSRDQRIKDVATWHKTLNKWMFDGQYNPTTFNLAFYMHNLFRQEIEKESQEIEVEKALPVPAPAPAPAAPAAAATPVTRQPDASPGVSEATESFIPEYAKEDKSSKAGLIIGIVAFLALAAIAGFFFLGGGGDGSEPTAQQAAQAAPPPVPEGPSAEEVAAQQQAELLQEQIRKLVEERSASMEEELRKQYDEQLSELEGQLEGARTAAQQAAEDRERKRREAEEAARRAAEEEAARLAAEQEAARLAEEQAARLAEEQAAREAEAEAARKAEEERLAQQGPPVVAPPPPPPPPAAPQVRRGDLVQINDPGVVPPRMTRDPQPRFPAVARRMGRTSATVKIKVLIDENGKVLETEVEEKAGFGFDAEAVQAARKAVFDPATKDGVPVKVWHTLAIQFRQ